ncbi:potassium channel family protein [Aeromicrobium sp.]|uniref:potassium channel family protein n=1 Tax=Aeromicrobium sp. TaxID=1871063 RepID=UPI003D6B1C68
MNWVLPAIGAAIVLTVLLDIFRTLAHPGAQGFLSRTMLESIWRWSHHSQLTGPLAMLAVISVWGVLAVLGWALIYWPHVPEGFTSLHTGGTSFIDAIYISLVTISTLGFGDVYPASDWLRVVNPLEALFGFAMLTVAVSWVLQVYPALARRKALAIRLALLRRADSVRVIHHFGAAGAARLLDDLCASVVNVRVDLGDYPETYYFRTDEESDSLAANLGYAVELGNAGGVSGHEEVRHAGDLLLRALDDFAAMIDAKFLHTGDATSNVLHAYASDHHPSRE